MSDPESDNDALPAVSVPRRGQLESERARFAARAEGGRLAEGLEPPPASRAATVRAFVRDLEEWVIRTLARFNVKAERREGRVGLWVVDGKREDKIAAIGIRL
ncbi:MAG TPA: hypothetical protein PKG80_00990, partial [Acidobacteriota bacterium]|nr:hypothetical protein [Acidobacteriota bacterium]